MKIHLVLQGGGANVVTLMAAAQAIERLNDDETIELLSVTGVSAGAITACMLASPVSMETYRARVQIKAGEVIDKFSPVKVHGLNSKFFPYKYCKYYKLFKHVWSGKSVLDEQDMVALYEEIFESSPGSVQHFDDLNIDTFVTTTDIRDKERTTFGTGISGTPKIALALADSSALPIVFRNYKSASARIDGGIAGNLPVGLLTNIADTNERILAISFKKESEKFAKNLPSYLARLFSSSIDGAVQENIKRIKNAGGSVYNLPRLYGVIDFEKALKEGLDEEIFVERSKEYQKKIEEILEPMIFRAANFTTRSELEEKILKANEFLEGNSTLEKTEKVTIVKIAPPGSDKDEITQEVRYHPDEGGAQVVSAKMASLAKVISDNDEEWEILNQDGQKIEAVRLVIPEQNSDDDLVASRSVYILSKEMTKNDGYFRVSQTSTGDHFQPFRRFHADHIGYRNKDLSNTEVVNHVYRIPKSLGSEADFKVMCLYKNKDLITELGCSLANLDRMHGKFVHGKELTPQEIRDEIGIFNTNKYHIYGWRTYKVPSDHYCGSAICNLSKIPASKKITS